VPIWDLTIETIDCLHTSSKSYVEGQSAPSSPSGRKNIRICMVSTAYHWPKLSLQLGHVAWCAMTRPLLRFLEGTTRDRRIRKLLSALFVSVPRPTRLRSAIPTTVPNNWFRVSSLTPARVTYRTTMSTPAPAGRLESGFERMVTIKICDRLGSKRSKLIRHLSSLLLMMFLSEEGGRSAEAVVLSFTNEVTT
jgi:hypothetical protein